MLSVNNYKARFAVEALNEDGIFSCGRSSFGPNYLTKFLEMNNKSICKVSFDDKTSIQNLVSRQQIYDSGFLKDGIHYVRLGRTAGAAKQGWVWFIDENLYEEAVRICCGNIPLKDLVSYEAYKSLCFSGWRKELYINPDNIVIIEDYEGSDKCDADKVKVNPETKQFFLESGEGEYSYNIWDGEGLIDYRMLDCEYASIRAPFFKCNAIATDLQSFFKDHNITTVTDMFGNVHNAKDVELITTPSSMKWMKWIKHGYTLEQWKNHMNSLENTFGICKLPSEPRYLNNVGRVSYQMCMMIPKNRILEANGTQEYIDMLSDNDFFMEHCKNIGNFDKLSIVNDLDSLPYWRKTKEFATCRVNISRKIVGDAKIGKILVNNSTNLTIFGNPLRLLYASAGLEVEDLPHLDDSYACYTQAFGFGERMCGMRSPFNAPSMAAALTNVYVEEYEKYFPSAHHCLFIDAISSFQDRTNGSDFDGDFMMVTSSDVFVEYAFDYFLNTRVPVNETPKLSSVAYEFNSSAIARLDNIIADNQEIIGLSSNCAVNALSNWWTTGDNGMWEIAIIQAINAQNAIDSAKRLFDVDISKENKRLCKLVDKCTWFSKIKSKNAKFESSCSMDVLTEAKYLIPDQYRELSIMEKLVDTENNYNISEHYNLDELHSLMKAFIADRLMMKKMKNFDMSILDNDVHEIVLEIKHFKLRHNYEFASLLRDMMNEYDDIGFIELANWIKASGCNVSGMFSKEYTEKSCICCGKPFKAKQKRQVICGDYQCKKDYMIIKYKNSKGDK